MSYTSIEGLGEGLQPVQAHDSKAVLHALFDAALAAAAPEGKFKGLLPPRPRGRTIVLGAGKPVARMAAAFEEAWGAPVEGMVITRYGHSTPTRYIKVVEAAHPVPDEAGLAATAEVLEQARSANEDDLVVFLIAGGASSLLTMPIEGLSLSDKQDITRQLLRSGAPIAAMNSVRKALSAIKGGKLALAAAPAQTVTYIMSDVPGDDPAVVGSGPSIVQPFAIEEALDILRRFDIAVSPAARELMRRSSGGAVAPRRAPVHVIVNPRMALDAAARKAQSLGFTPLVLGDAIEGEAREVGVVMAGIAQSILRYDTPVEKPCVILSGGETTVTMRGKGRGGRNTEFLLALAAALHQQPGVAAIACDTDGIDGSEDNAGAWFDEALIVSADRLEQVDHLSRNDSYSYFQSVDRLTFTGPTLTNVNDFRAIIVR